MTRTRPVPCGSQAVPINTLMRMLANELLRNAACFPLRNGIMGTTLRIPSKGHRLFLIKF